MKTTTGQSVIIGFAIIGLTACGGGGSSGNTPTPTPDPESKPSALKAVASDSVLENAIKDGLSGSKYHYSASAPFSINELASDASQATQPNNFSQTLLQEEGVDESDIVKYDGSVLYIADTSYQFSDSNDLIPFAILPEADNVKLTAQIRIFETDPLIAEAEAIGIIESTDGYTIEGLFLHQSAGNGKQLISIGHNQTFIYPTLFAYDPFWQNGETHVEIYSVDRPESPSLSWKMTFDGTLLASRRIGDYLYLISRYSPYIEGRISYPQNEQDTAHNSDLLDKTSVADLLPRMSVRNNPEQSMLDATDCYISNPDFPANGIEDLPSGSIVSITRIDLESPDNMESVCFNGYSSGIYVAPESLYVTASSSNHSLIHKFSLASSGIDYRGSAQIKGFIGTSNPAFLMSEKDGVLRVVSSIWDMEDFPILLPEANEEPQTNSDDEADFGRHRITLLRESIAGDTNLEVLAQLPNTDRPEPIGKPDEDIYAVRYFGDRAYIVTFRTVDPLYAIDLSDPQNPEIGGELEVPGFSTLLQPLGDNYLLGVGHEVDTESNRQGGVKISLYDVSNIASPILANEFVIGEFGSYSGALYDHHALSLLAGEDGRYRISLPISRHATLVDDSQEFPYYDWTDTGLYEFEADTAGGSLSQRGTIIVERAEDGSRYSDTYQDRGILHNNAVFYVHDAKVWSAFWGSNEIQTQD